MRKRFIFCVLCLLAACAGYLPEGSAKKTGAGGHVVRESAPAELLSKKKPDGVKIAFRCSIARNDGCYMMLARILRNDSATHIAPPGVRLMLADGDSVVLKAERPSACCSGWADGRWYNVSFRLTASDVEKLTYADLLSVTIPFHDGRTVSRETAAGREKAVAEMLQSVTGEE